jgi:hypothetical protein
MSLSRYSAMVAAVPLIVVLIGCSDSGGVTTPSTVSPATASASVTMGSATLTPEVTEAMERTLQDEYHAETTYLGVLGDLGDVLPFANVVRAEQRHSASIARLYESRGLDAPASRWTVDNVPHFESLGEACAAAVSAEQDNVALYDTCLALDIPWDVRAVFENNRAASLERHLPAFEACACPTCPAS